MLEDSVKSFHVKCIVNVQFDNNEDCRGEGDSKSDHGDIDAGVDFV